MGFFDRVKAAAPVAEMSDRITYGSGVRKLENEIEGIRKEIEMATQQVGQLCAQNI